MHRLLACALAAFIPAIASAQTDCRSIEADLDRLACYDRESGRTPIATPVETDSQWRVRVEKSEMTDEENVYVSVDADEPVSCQQFSDPEKPTLVLRCQENTTSLIIATSGCHLVSSQYNDYGDVTYRIDDLSSRTRGFDESTSNRSLGLWSGGTSIPFIKSMFGHKELLTRFTPFNSNPVTARFQIGGLEEAIAPLREACGW